MWDTAPEITEVSRRGAPFPSFTSEAESPFRFTTLYRYEYPPSVCSHFVRCSLSFSQLNGISKDSSHSVICLLASEIRFTRGIFLGNVTIIDSDIIDPAPWTTYRVEPASKR